MKTWNFIDTLTKNQVESISIGNIFKGLNNKCGIICSITKTDKEIILGAVIKKGSYRLVLDRKIDRSAIYYLTELDNGIWSFFYGEL